ncbi:MAG: hypothetical protein WDM96_12355 [Lacunisphaera sp.]
MRSKPAGDQVTGNSPFTLLTWLVLAVAGLLAAAWLWSCWCSFPSNPWNDIRVAPAIALHHGISIYTPEGSGPVSTWIYGPVPLLLLWPAGLASTAAGAIAAAGAIHIGLRVFSLILVCLYWPASQPPASPARDRQLRLAAALLSILLVRNESSGYLVYSSDSPGLVFGLLSLLALSSRRYWTAAACAAAAAACKQTLLGVAVAEIVWLFAAVSAREAWRQSLRCAVAGAAIAISAIGFFGTAGLWHTMVELPASFPLVEPLERLRRHQVHLLLHLGLPLAVMAGGWRFFFRRTSPVLLPTLAFLCTLPLSLVGLMKIGGNVNSLHSFWLWFPPVLIAVISTGSFLRLGPAGGLALAMLAAGVAGCWMQITPLRVRPNVQAYREAAQLAARLPEGIWFPMHPIVTLYSDGRFYHDYDGLLERVIAGQRLSDAQFFAHMPRHRQVTATLLPIGWGPADQAEARLPADLPVSISGSWQLQGAMR